MAGSLGSDFCLALRIVPFFFVCTADSGTSRGIGFNGQYALSFGRWGGGPSTSVLRLSLSACRTVAEGAERNDGTDCCPFAASLSGMSADAVAVGELMYSMLEPNFFRESYEVAEPSFGDGPGADWLLEKDM